MDCTALNKWRQREESACYSTPLCLTRLLHEKHYTLLQFCFFSSSLQLMVQRGCCTHNSTFSEFEGMVWVKPSNQSGVPNRKERIKLFKIISILFSIVFRLLHFFGEKRPHPPVPHSRTSDSQVFKLTFAKNWPTNICRWIFSDKGEEPTRKHQTGLRDTAKIKLHFKEDIKRPTLITVSSQQVLYMLIAHSLMCVDRLANVAVKPSKLRRHIQLGSPTTGRAAARFAWSESLVCSNGTSCSIKKSLSITRLVQEMHYFRC